MEKKSFILKNRKLIIILTAILAAAAVIPLFSLRINPDLESYLPDNIESRINNQKIGDLFGEDIQIDVSALGEGGLIDKFKIVFKSEAFKDLFMLLSGALINHFICVSPSLDESEKQLNRSELLTKIKEGDFTEEDIANAKKGILATIKTIDDEQDTQISYYFGQELTNTRVSTEEYIKKIEKIQKEDVINIARKVSINTIYFLKD